MPREASHVACSLPRRGQTSSAGTSSDGLLRAGLSGKADVAAPVQSAGMLTPLVPLLGTVGKKDGGHLRGWTTFTVPSYHWGPTVEGLCYRRGSGTSLGVQWLEPCASIVGVPGLIPSWGTQILHAMQCSEKIEKITCLKKNDMASILKITNS